MLITIARETSNNKLREIHDFMLSRGRINGSRAATASAAVEPERRKCIQTGNMLISKPTEEKEPEITILNDIWEREHPCGGAGKAASSAAAAAPGGFNVTPNKAKMIHNFVASNGKLYY